MSFDCEVVRLWGFRIERGKRGSGFEGTLGSGIWMAGSHLSRGVMGMKWARARCLDGETEAWHETAFGYHGLCIGRGHRHD